MPDSEPITGQDTFSEVVRLQTNSEGHWFEGHLRPLQAPWFVLVDRKLNEPR